MKIAISGKGGVGKTTLSAMLATAWHCRERNVIALDADPDANLAAALGVSSKDEPTPLAQMHDLIEDRTGSADNYGGYFKLNPKVDDIPDRYAVCMGSVRLLALGGVSKGGSGCICPATALVKALLSHLLLGRDDAIVMDMEAGLEHLGRATVESMDALLVVVDGGPWSIKTALRVRQLGRDIGMKKIFAVANRLTGQVPAEQIRDRLEGMPLLGQLPRDLRLQSPMMQIVDDGTVQPSQAMLDHLGTIEGILSDLAQRV